jgi:hypothetical protein
MKSILVIALAALVTPALAESPYCTPKTDGMDRITKTGSSCPTGYFASGNCCEALHRDTPKAFPKYKGASCPYGTFTSGHYCERFR